MCRPGSAGAGSLYERPVSTWDTHLRVVLRGTGGWYIPGDLLHDRVDVWERLHILKLGHPRRADDEVNLSLCLLHNFRVVQHRNWK